MSFYDTQSIQIRALSPIHIKGKDVEYGHGFVRRDESTAYAIDSDRLGLFLYEETRDLSLLNRYIEEIEGYSARNKIKEYDFERFLSEARIYDNEKNRRREGELIQKGVFRAIVNATQENQFIRNGKGEPFIPGSSVKGAIRTAVLFKMVKNRMGKEPDWLNNEYMGKLKELEGKQSHLDEIKKEEESEREMHKRMQLKKSRKRAAWDIERFKRSMGNDLSYMIFQSNVPNQFGRVRKGPHTDFFRILSVTDSPPINVHEAGGHGAWGSNKKISVLSLRDDGTMHERSRIRGEVECFEGDVYVDIQLDRKLLTEFREGNPEIPFASISDLLDIVKEFARIQWSEECRLWDSVENSNILVDRIQQFYGRPADDAGLRLGWGTGLLGMTMLSLLDKGDPLRKRFRNIVFVDRDDAPAPKSRRVVMEDRQAVSPLGWVSIDVA